MPPLWRSISSATSAAHKAAFSSTLGPARKYNQGSAGRISSMVSTCSLLCRLLVNSNSTTGPSVGTNT
ncbi:hypothetical protein D3C80_1833360 [compost metagenome]